MKNKGSLKKDLKPKLLLPPVLIIQSHDKEKEKKKANQKHEKDLNEKENDPNCIKSNRNHYDRDVDWDLYDKDLFDESSSFYDFMITMLEQRAKAEAKFRNLNENQTAQLIDSYCSAYDYFIFTNDADFKNRTHLKSTSYAFWSSSDEKLKILMKIARKFLSLPASEACIERLISQFRDTRNQSNQRSSEDLVDAKMFIKIYRYFDIKKFYNELLRAKGFNI